jgi:pimeloyl-ACP methyl ester carboxylesterase
MGINVSNFFTPEFNNESAIGPWNASLEPTKAIIPQLDANRVLTGGVGEEVNLPTLTPEAYDNIILPDDLLSRMASAVSTDSNSSLPDSSVDLLTGEAMSEVYGDLSKFAADPDFAAKLNVAFGENWDAAAAKALAEGWFQGDFSDIPPVKVVSSAEIGGANGAFAAATDTIYLSKEFLTENAANPAAVADVLLEEIGHSVDARLNVTDSPGDEGAIFSRVVQGKDLSQGELQGLKGKDDRATVLFNGQTISIERASSFDIGNRWYVQAFDGSGKPIKNYDFGSNTLSNGKKGFAGDWGAKSPRSDIPNDNFALAFWTQADFQQGQTYNFNVRADDSYALAAVPVGAQDSNQWEFITQWKWNEDAYGGKTVQFTPKNSGKYWVLEYYRERDGNAYFDTSWEKVNSSYSPSPDPNRRVDNDWVQRNIGKTKGGDDRHIVFERVNSPGYIENRPTWVIIHGWNGEAGSFKDLGKAIEEYDGYQIGDQVLTLDWDAARTGKTSLNAAASWITTVGEKAAETLNKWGISPSNINLVGHSLGAYVAYEVSEKLGGINKLVALDPATTTIGGYSKKDQVNFSQYSNWSWGFYASSLGSEDQAQTADESFRVDFSGATPDSAHGGMKVLWTNMLKAPQESTNQYFGLEDIGSQDKPWAIDSPGKDSGFEATIWATDKNGLFGSGDNWIATEFKPTIAVAS